MGDLTINISRHEGRCNCGCGFSSMDWLTVEMVQDACDYFSKKLGKKVTLIITSWCRCEEWNAHEDGSDFSQHLVGKACDHYIKEVPLQELTQYYLDKYPGKFGIGVYEDFIHLDCRARCWRG